jgi:hypothetical protein
MNLRTICVCIVVVLAVLALLLLWNTTRPETSPTGAVPTHICPKGSTPVISGEEFLRELEDYQRRGYRCFFGLDGITPCCARR